MIMTILGDLAIRNGIVLDSLGRHLFFFFGDSGNGVEGVLEGGRKTTKRRTSTRNRTTFA